MNFRKKAIFTCDALTFLEHLPSEMVALTYLNPPYFTSFNLEQKKQQDEYAFYLSKIAQQSHRILINEGNLFIHWSQNSLIDVRLILNQVFGKEPNYEINWLKRNRNFSVNNGLKLDNDYILVYSKSDEPICNKLYRQLPPKDAASYSKKDERGQYRTTILTMPSDRPSLQFIWRGYQPPTNHSWRFTLDKLEGFALENRICFSSQGLPELKQYLDDHIGIEIGTVWDDIPCLIPPHERTNYDFMQTPLTLMERIIKIGSNPEDLILDPFCGTGTTLVAAQSLNRCWWGVDNSLEAQQITINRLLKNHGFKPINDYDVFSENDISQLPAIATSYTNVVVRIGEIANLKQDMEMKLAEITKLKDENDKLQQTVEVLTDSVLKLKKLMNLGENDDEQRVEDAIKQMADWIIASIASRSASIESYVNTVCIWLTGGWERLHSDSQSFLPQAELLFEVIKQTNSKDYSPFIIQYCRALENELLIKLFTTYTNDIHNRIEDINLFLVSDLKNEKTGRFAKFLQGRKVAYTFGDMSFIMNLLQENGRTLNESSLLKDFRYFAISYFNESIVDREYLEQIKRINEDFRCKAAHPYILNAEAAEKCRDQVRLCLNKLILNYSGKP